MTDHASIGDVARAVFSGMAPTPRATGTEATSRVPKSLMATMPLVLAGAMTVSMNLTTPVESASAATKRPAKPKSQLSATLRSAVSGAAAVAVAATKPATTSTPSTYTVTAGDTVSGIAGRFGLSTATVLAANGLGWKSLIFPGQVLKLGSAAAVKPVAAPSPTAAVAPASSRYTIQKGDTITRVAAHFGVSTQSVLTANGLSWSSIIYPGQTIAIPVTTLAVQNVSSVTPTSATPPTAPSGIPGLTAEHDRERTHHREGRPRARVSAPGPRRSRSPPRCRSPACATSTYGDRDSLGLFQQRPSAGWGTAGPGAAIPHTRRAGVLRRPDQPQRARTRGLLDIPGWQTMTVTQAAQAVQISAYPDAYAQVGAAARRAGSPTRLSPLAPAPAVSRSRFAAPAVRRLEREHESAPTR